MKKGIRVLVITLILTMLNICTVLAVTPGFTGWVSEQGSPRYYLNGNKVTNSWVKQGVTYYYLNENGVVVPNFIVNEDGVSVSAVRTYLDSNNGGKIGTIIPATPDTYKPVRDIYGVTTDYEAFKKRYSGYAEAFGMNTSYEAYLASYNGQKPGTKYLDAYMAYLNDTYNAHRYDHHYEYMQNDTHKAYCECGAWQIQNCHRTIELGVGGPYKCPLCSSVTQSK